MTPLPLPAADESPFAVRQRLYAALPLPLGATSACEWLEVVLTERFEPEDVRGRLQASRAPWASRLAPCCSMAHSPVAHSTLLARRCMQTRSACCGARHCANTPAPPHALSWDWPTRVHTQIAPAPAWSCNHCRRSCQLGWSFCQWRRWRSRRSMAGAPGTHSCAGLAARCAQVLNHASNRPPLSGQFPLHDSTQSEPHLPALSPASQAAGTCLKDPMTAVLPRN